MISKRIEVRYGKTINTGNYENEKIEAGISFDINSEEEETEDVKKAFQKAWKLVKDFVEMKEEEILSRR